MPPANLIDGRSIAEQIHLETASRLSQLLARGVRPGLDFIRVGEDPASRVYVGMKERTAQRLGINSKTHVLAADTPQGELLALIRQLNGDAQVHGILVQAPLPDDIDVPTVFSTVDPRKDVDGFHPVNVGKLMLGDPTGFASCTPAGIHQLLIRENVQLKGAEVVILGRGN